MQKFDDVVNGLTSSSKKVTDLHWWGQKINIG